VQITQQVLHLFICKNGIDSILAEIAPLVVANFRFDFVEMEKRLIEVTS
jgi:hypothetical protein